MGKDSSAAEITAMMNETRVKKKFKTVFLSFATKDLGYSLSIYLFMPFSIWKHCSVH